MKKNWYAIYTKSHCELKVCALLTKKKIDNYCPLNQITSNHGNKNKKIHEPLFSCFVFVHATDAQLDIILRINSILTFVYWLGKPVVINNVEIENIQSFTKEHCNIRLEKVTIKANLNVRIINNPHNHINSNIDAEQNSKSRIFLPSLGYVLIAGMEKSITEGFNYQFETRKMVN